FLSDGIGATPVLPMLHALTSRRLELSCLVASRITRSSVIAKRPRWSPRTAPSTGSAGPASTRGRFCGAVGRREQWPLADRTSRRRSGRERAAPLPAQHADPRNRVRHCRRRRGRPDRLHALARGRAWSRLVRLVVGKRGTVPMRTELIVRFGYGGWVPWV